MNKYKIIFLLTLSLLTLFSVQAQNKPQWVNKGVASLNKERTNDTYEFVKFHTHGLDLSALQSHATDPLRQYVADLTGTQYNQVAIMHQPGSNDYDITVNNGNSKQTMSARLIDTFHEFDDFEESNYEFEYYQLYVVSKPDVIPVFDDISLTRKYKASTTLLSIVPGLGQIYKGQTTKGFVIMGSEVVLIGAAIGFQIKKHEFDDNVKKGIYNVDSWKSKSTSMRVFRNISLGLAAGIYVYNILDAMLSEGANHVVIKPAKGHNLAVMPIVAPDCAAIGLHYTF